MLYDLYNFLTSKRFVELLDWTEYIIENYGNIISTICSSKYFDPGHIKRIDFLKYIEKIDDPLIQIHIYNNLGKKYQV